MSQGFNNFCKVCNHLIDEGDHCNSCAERLKRWELFDDCEIREIHNALVEKVTMLKPYLGEEGISYIFQSLIDELNEVQRLKEAKEASFAGKPLDLTDEDIPF